MHIGLTLVNVRIARYQLTDWLESYFDTMDILDEPRPAAAAGTVEASERPGFRVCRSVEYRFRSAVGCPVESASR